VATSNTTRDVVVNTALVVEEVVVNGEGSLHGSVSVELILDTLDAVGLAEVFLPGLARAGAAVEASAGVTATGSVWPAGFSDDTSVLEVLPNVVEVTTVAAVVVGVAGDGVLRSEDDISALDAESVRESLGGTESPA
jgi:hypothetical protein